MSNIELNSQTIKEESKLISIPSFELNRKSKESLNIFIGLKLSEFFSKTIEKLGNNNPVVINNILLEKSFGENILQENILIKIEDFIKKNDLKYSNLKNLEIISGKLYVRFDNGDKIVFDLSAKSMEELVIKTETTKKLNEYKDELSNTEKVIMWGSVISLTYGQFIEAGEFVDRQWDRANMIHGDMKAQEFLTKAEIEIDGKMVEFSIADNVFDKLREKHLIGKRHKLSKVDFLDILKNDGIVFNHETGKFEETSERKINEKIKNLEFKDIKASVEKLKYEEYYKINKDAGVPEKEIFTKSEYKKAIKANIALLEDLNRELNIGKNRKIKFGEFFQSRLMSGLFGKFAGKSLHYIMFPIFFKEIHKHSGNLDSYVKGAVEFGSFMGGIALSNKILEKIKIPFIAKMALGLVAGGAAAIGGEKALHSVDKTLLGSMPNREDFFERLGLGNKKNIEAHVYTGGVFNDAADSINKDIGLDFNKVIKFFYNDWERKEGLDINIYENNINFGTSIIEYLNERTRGVEHWNKEVEEFKVIATQRINTEVLDKNFKYSDVFENENIFGMHSFKENLSKGLETLYNPKQRTGSIEIKYKKIANKNAQKIFKFTEKNLDKNLLLGQFIDDKDPKKGKSFNKIKDDLKVFLKENKILKSEKDIKEYVEYYEGIFYNKMDQKIDDILGNPNVLENLLGSSGNIHNSTKNLKENLKKNIKASYYRNKIEVKIRKKDPNTNKIEMTPIEAEISSEINKLKINSTFIKEYEKNIIGDKELLDKALNGELKTDNIIKYGNITFIEQKDRKSFPTTGNISDIIYINSLSEKDRKFTSDIFKNILNPNSGNLLRGKGSVYMKEKRKFKKLLENDNYYIFFNRMIDFKRRKVFIENVQKYNDSVQWDVDNSVILNTRKQVVETVNPIILKTKKWVIDTINSILN